MTNELGARDFIKLALSKGMKPSEIKRELRNAGVRTPFRYSYSGHTGSRARARYLKQRSMCVEGCGNRAPEYREPRMCDWCLERKWAE